MEQIPDRLTIAGAPSPRGVDGSATSNELGSARRRLIGGVFAAPAVLALHSGSALAASSNLRCVNNQNLSPASPYVSDTADLWVRVQLYALWEAGPGTTVVDWYLAGSSVEAMRFGASKAVNAFLSSGNWKKVSFPSTGFATVSAETWTAPPAPVSPQTFGPGPKWVALRFNPSSGNRVEIIGVVDGSATGTAVTGSCWSSFTGVAIG